MYDNDSIHPVLFNQREQINAGGNTVTNIVDTAGFSGGMLVVTVLLDALNSATVFDKLQLQESDASSTGYSIIEGCNALTDNQADGSSAPTFDNESDHSMIIFYVPLMGARKRYYRVRLNNTGSGNAGVSCTALIIGGQNPTSPASSSLVDGTDGAIFRAVTT